MRGDLNALTVERPRTLAAALSLMAQPDRPWPIAGGTDLYVALEAGRTPASRFLDLSRLDDLRGIAANATELSLGALTTYTELRRSPRIARAAPILARMAATVGAVAIQNRGTLGGSLGNASPASDPAPLLLALDAEVELASRPGRHTETRRLPLAEFFTGYRTTALRPIELITAVVIPLSSLSGWRHYYRKVGARRAQAISKVVLAGALREGGRPRRCLDIRIAVGSVAATTIRAYDTESVLRGRRLDADAVRTAQSALDEELSPIDDLRSTALYRAFAARNLLAEMLLRG